MTVSSKGICIIIMSCITLTPFPHWFVSFGLPTKSTPPPSTPWFFFAWFTLYSYRQVWPDFLKPVYRLTYTLSLTTWFFLKRREIPFHLADSLHTKSDPLYPEVWLSLISNSNWYCDLTRAAVQLVCCSFSCPHLQECLKFQYKTVKTKSPWAEVLSWTAMMERLWWDTEQCCRLVSLSTAAVVAQWPSLSAKSSALTWFLSPYSTVT